MPIQEKKYKKYLSQEYEPVDESAMPYLVDIRAIKAYADSKGVAIASLDMVLPLCSESILHLTSTMSIISDAIQAKCLAFSDRIIKLNDYLLVQAVAAHEDYRKSKIQKKGKQTSSFLRQTSDISVAAVPVYLQSVSNLCNQLLRAGTSIGANNAEASSAISKADFKSKSYIALKEARESMYWLELLHRNNYLTDIQFNSLYADAEELVKVLTHRCKKLDGVE